MIIDDAKQYCNDVLTNRIVACKSIKQACSRFLNDLQRDDLYYDSTDVEVFNAFCNSLKHFTGRFAGQSFVLSSYQKFFIANVLGLKFKTNGLRKYKSVYLQIARKNGKSSLIAALSLYFLMLDNEENAEVIVCANSIEQARINLQLTTSYSSSIDPDKKLLIPQYSKIKFRNSKLQIRAADHTKLDGLNTSVAIIDEYHQGSKEVLDVLRSGQGSRTQPLSIIITTAGLDLTKHCYDLYKLYKSMLDNKTDIDDNTFILIYELDEEDVTNDLYLSDYELIEKANPNIDISVSKQFIIDEIESIKTDYSNRISVLTKNLNIWVDHTIVNSNDEKYIDDEVVLNNMCDVNLKDFAGCWAFASVDLSSVSDLNVLTLMIPRNGYFYFKNFFFLPSDNHNIKDVKSQLNVWNKEGYINLTTGNCLDSDAIVKQLKKIVEDSNIQVVELHLDVYNSTSFQLKMAEELPDVPVIPFSQSFLNFNKSTKELKMLMLREQCRIDKNAVTRWNFHNAIIKETSQGNVKCLKLNNNKANKIDSVISMQMALGGYLSSNYCYVMN